jgi:hypothetical protein
MEIKELIDKVRNETFIPPLELSEYKLRLSAEYGYLSEQLSNILKEKPGIWLEIRQREGVKSDKIADTLWEASEFGKKETELKIQLKSIEKLSSAISSRLQMYETEARLSR